MANLNKLALYFHIPFCIKRCRYCDFYSETGVGKELVDKTLDALLLSLDSSLDRLKPGSISTVFIGGGTPSLVEPDLFNRFLGALNARIGDVDEFSVEVNPESLSYNLLETLKNNAVDRISMGVQTYDDQLLSWLGRPAGIGAIERSDALLKDHWTGRLSRDLLAALPGSPGRLLSDLKHALRDDPGHLSMYELTVEEGTALAESDKDLRMLPGEDSSANEWQLALDYLDARGYQRYEISNFARIGDESLHNLVYWKMDPYLGIGPGAASTIPGPGSAVLRRQEPKDLFSWLAAPTVSFEETRLSTGDLALEHFMMGLRISDGLSLSRFKSIFGITPAESAPQAVERWINSGALISGNGSLRPTRAGMELLDGILGDIALDLDKQQWPEHCQWPQP